VQCHQEQICRRSDGQPLTSWCTYFGNIKYTSGGADYPSDTSNLFSFLPFPPLPIRWNVAFLTCITVEFHCIPQWYVLSFTSIFSRCCLQYASVLQAGIIFQAINWLIYFFISRRKETPLGSVIKHTFTTTQNTKLLHNLCTLGNYSPKVNYLLQCWFPMRRRNGFAGNVLSTTKWDLRSFGILHSVGWQFLPALSCLTLEDGTNRLYRNVGS